MKKFLGVTWVDWVCIIVAVISAEMAQEAFKPKGFWSFVVYIIVWAIAFTISFFIIKQILKWTGKN
jgi:uncharacterized membrane protein